MTTFIARQAADADKSSGQKQDEQPQGKAEDQKDGEKKEGDEKGKEATPAEKMARRWPQKVLVGALVGLPVNDDGDRTLGLVERVVRAPDGGIKLIVDYNRTFGWFGWFTRPVAVPIEVVAIYGKQIASIDMQPDAYAKAATWTRGQEVDLPRDETIRIALTKR